MGAVKNFYHDEILAEAYRREEAGERDEPIPDAAGYAGWADPRLGRIYDMLDKIRDEFTGTENGCLSTALKEIELADEYVEKHRKEAE